MLTSSPFYISKYFTFLPKEMVLDCLCPSCHLTNTSTSGSQPCDTKSTPRHLYNSDIQIIINPIALHFINTDMSLSPGHLHSRKKILQTYWNIHKQQRRLWNIYPDWKTLGINKSNTWTPA